MDRHFFQESLLRVISPGVQRETIDFLKRYGLLCDRTVCRQCGTSLELQNRQSLTDGFGWICKATDCDKAWHSIRQGSFFSGSKVKLRLWIHVFWLWSIETSIRDAVLTTGLGEKTVISMYRRCRSVCTRYLQDHPVRLGGGGIICSLDESCFSHKPKYHRGRAPEREIWVFGIVDTSFKPSRAYLKVVPNRSESTLLPIIQEVCRPGTIIFSDSWAAYRNIQERLSLDHRKVNHSDPAHRFIANDGTHTQHIESYWGKRKLRIKAMKGIRREALQEYLNEFMWRDIFFDNHFYHLLNTIKDQHPF